MSPKAVILLVSPVSSEYNKIIFGVSRVGRTGLRDGRSLINNGR